MDRTKSILIVAISVALAFTLSCDTGSGSGNTKCDAIFNPETSFCYDGEVYDKCNGMQFNPSTQICTGNVVISNTFTDSRDGNKYKMVSIGTQIWMAENLNYNAGSSVCYNNLPSNCNTYGRLYNWNTALTACPSGWHLPSVTEWNVLTSYAGGAPTAGTKLKAKNGWNSDDGTDDFGFSALPGSYGLSNGNFADNIGNSGYWWSASGWSNNADYRFMQHNRSQVYGDDVGKGALLSVRCLRD